VERCWFCGSAAVVVANGQYVCSSCGTVLGVVYYVPNVAAELRRRAEERPRRSEQPKREKRTLHFSDVIESLIGTFAIRLAREPREAEALRREALRLFRSLPRTAWQGKSPRTVAAAVLYMVSGRTVGEVERATGVAKSAISTAVKALAR